MAPRVNSELLLVGSLPAESADAALRSAAGFFGALVFALPDGETGPRSAWVGYERERLVRLRTGGGNPAQAFPPPGLGLLGQGAVVRSQEWQAIQVAAAGPRARGMRRILRPLPSALSRPGRPRPAGDRSGESLSSW